MENVDTERGAEAQNEIGNEAVKEKNYQKAINSYTNAIHLNPMPVKYYANRSACHLKREDRKNAIADAHECIRRDPTFMKGYERLATALVAAKQWDEANATLLKAMELHPSGCPWIAQLRKQISSEQKRLEVNIAWGYDSPGQLDVFSDGTKCMGEPFGLDVRGRQREALAVRRNNRSKKIVSNPSAGDVRRREEDRRKERRDVMYLRQREIIDENERLAKEQLESKRIFGLAKQTQVGLADIGVRFDLTALANIIKQGVNHKKGRTKDVIGSSDVDEETKVANDILAAAEKYDMRQVARLLDLTIPERKTFGT